ncbi:4Fe-4S dicluster domain-containing protein [Vibrio variabilis]|uniref:4Fe-4S dicluster domain-containing protein n=1 Tax=Vibrio variabilis TaxID=990271 RepID=UPI000DD86514|nr:4Fe-4S dicluster domain-containing protein [Vibrio variabilis]
MKSFVVADPKKCIGCSTCMAACSEVHKAQGLQGHPRLNLVKHNDSTAPVACRHCEDAPCAAVCPVGAIVADDAGVFIKEAVCVGCTLCSAACPFGAISLDGSRPVAMATSYDTYIPSTPRSSNPSTSVPSTFGSDLLVWEPGVKSIAVKCDLCRSRGEGPACIATCPMDAISLVDVEAVNVASDTKRRQAACDMQIEGMSAKGLEG